MVKNLPVKAGDASLIPQSEDPLEKEMATHSSVLAWKIPVMGSLVGCRLWVRTESDTTEATEQQQQH